MAIEKKSLISTLKTTKKANIASAPVSGDAITKTETTRKATSHLQKSTGNLRKSTGSLRKVLVKS